MKTEYITVINKNDPDIAVAINEKMQSGDWVEFEVVCVWVDYYKVEIALIKTVHEL